MVILMGMLINTDITPLPCFTFIPQGASIYRENYFFKKQHFCYNENLYGSNSYENGFSFADNGLGAL